MTTSSRGSTSSGWTSASSAASSTPRSRWHRGRRTDPSCPWPALTRAGAMSPLSSQGLQPYVQTCLRYFFHSIFSSSTPFFEMSSNPLNTLILEKDLIRCRSFFRSFTKKETLNLKKHFALSLIRDVIVKQHHLVYGQLIHTLKIFPLNIIERQPTIFKIKACKRIWWKRGKFSAPT